MERITFLYENTFLYGSSILLALGAAVAVCVFLALYLRRGHGIAAAVSVPLAMTLSLVLSRFLHWYCRESLYPDLLTAMTDLTAGDFALMGAFGGCALAVLILRLTRIAADPGRMLDCMSLGGCAGIGVGRLSSFFNASDRGMLLEAELGFPWVYPVVNPVSGVAEYRLATFLIQTMVAAVLFAVLLVFYIAGKRKGSLKDGDTCVVFLLCHGAAQVLLDSTRYDSLYFRSNGFVSIVQVLGALAIGLAAAVFSVRLVRKQGWKKWYLLLWLGLAALLGLGGYMEYHVQRHPGEAAFAYSIMGTCLAGLVILCLTIRALAERKKQGHFLRIDRG